MIRRALFMLLLAGRGAKIDLGRDVRARRQPDAGRDADATPGATWYPTPRSAPPARSRSRATDVASDRSLGIDADTTGRRRCPASYALGDP
jgi:hypothetical protein